jgi:hypothetical protein
MERAICPSCAGTAIRMPVLSDVSHVDYFQCEICRAVSLAPKDGSSPTVLEMMTPARSATTPRLTRH